MFSVVIGAHDGILLYDGYNSDITNMSIKTWAGQDIGLETMLDRTECQAGPDAGTDKK